MNKYEIDFSKKGVIFNKKTGEEVEIYQIRALIDIPSVGVKAGDMGGFIEEESNLSQIGNCWVFPNSVVGQESIVMENAAIHGESQILGGSKVKGNAIIEDTKLYESEVDRIAILEKAELTRCKIHEAVSIHDSKLRNCEVWKGSFLHSTFISVHEKCLFLRKASINMTDSHFSYSGKSRDSNGVGNVLVITSSLEIDKSRLENVKSIKLLSPLLIRNVKSVGSVRIETKPSELGNRLIGKPLIGMLNKSKITLSGSQLAMNAWIRGKTEFSDCEINTFGLIDIKSAGRIKFQDVSMEDFSRITVSTPNMKKSIERIHLVAEDHYII